MGIAPSNFELLLLEAAQRPFYGKALVLGRQMVQFDQGYLKSRAEAHGIPLRHLAADDQAKFSFSNRGLPSDEFLFRSLGCDSLDALDFMADEGADIIHNLNLGGVPESVKGKYDLIFDGGTLEHVFHMPNALQSIHDLLAVDGRILHSSPMNNWVDHGFVQLCPTFFADYYDANLYKLGMHKLNKLEMWEFSQGLGQVFDYDPAFLHDHHFGAFGSAIWALFFVATKTPASTGGRVPTQSRYAAGIDGPDYSGIIEGMLDAGIRETTICGAGLMGRAFLRTAQAKGLAVKHLVDGNPRLVGQEVDGMPVVSLAEATMSGNHVYLVASYTFAREIRQDILRAYPRVPADIRILTPFR